MPPRTRYAHSRGAHIAYQVLGEGPLDLVFVPGLVSHLDQYWDDRNAARFLQRIASFARLIVFDKRGTGLSDRDVAGATLEDRMDDVRAVMDDAGSERAAILGYSEGGALSVMFAATYPERVSALVLAATGARFAPGGPDEPWRASVATAAADLQRIAREEWGTGATARWFAPSLVGSERARESIARWERMASNPSAVLAFVEAFGDVDMTPVLPSIAVPTLVITRADDRVFGSEHGRYLARAVPGARYFEQPGDHHIIWLGPADELVDEMQEFLTGVRGPASVDRVLSTVLFTDVVGSTSRLAEVGDERWREVLDRHDDVAARELDRFRGRLVKSTGDGLLATFDGPARAIRCAGALAERGRELGVELRAGVHTGEIEIRGDDVAGIAVHVAARIAGLAGADEILVSGTVPPLTAGSGLEFEDAGEHELKGVPGRWPVSRVLGSAVGSRS